MELWRPNERWVGVTDTNGRVVWINAQNVAYVQDFQTYRAVHFIGKDNYFQPKDTAEELVMMLRPPV